MKGNNDSDVIFNFPNGIIEFNNVKYKLIENSSIEDVCEICDLSGLCDDCINSCPVGLCVDLCSGSKHSYFKKID